MTEIIAILALLISFASFYVNWSNAREKRHADLIQNISELRSRLYGCKQNVTTLINNLEICRATNRVTHQPNEDDFNDAVIPKWIKSMKDSRNDLDEAIELLSDLDTQEKNTSKSLMELQQICMEFEALEKSTDELQTEMSKELEELNGMARKISKLNRRIETLEERKKSLVDE
ncbi:MAG: hypothetical protein AAGH72_06605 [Verrucomicrobiota bacterium]